MPLVQLSNKTTFAAESEKSLLDSAKAKNIVLEYSCRTGRCGVCKAKVLQGETVLLQEEQSLSLSEVEDGYVLTCCRAAITDVQLDIEDLGEFSQYPAKTLPSRIDSIELLSADVVKVVLRLPPSSPLLYLPGQYIDVITPQARRSYSLANAPRCDGKLELQIRQVEQGIMSRYWFSDAKVNDLVRLEGPLGTFGLRALPVDSLIFIATGTGIAPVKAILEQLANSAELVAGKRIYVYWGGRSVSDIYWCPEFSGLPIKFVPLLSRPQDGWAGRIGYVQQAVLDDELDLKRSAVYACGSDRMIQSAKVSLVEAGLPSKHFYSDAFVSSN